MTRKAHQLAVRCQLLSVSDRPVLAESPVTIDRNTHVHLAPSPPGRRRRHQCTPMSQTPRGHPNSVNDCRWSVRDLRLQGSSLGFRIRVSPHSPTLPTCLENSHANHTWQRRSRQTPCFKGSKAPSPWVQFPSPAPLFVVWRVPALS